MTSDDIQTIHNFYASYFQLKPGKNNTDTLERDPPKRLEQIDLYDNNGIYWGSVNLYNESNFELTKEGKERFYQAVLLPSVLGANKNLTQDDMDAFSRLVGLPRGAWTQSHYCRFSFAFADWISDPVENDFGRPGIRQIKDILCDFRISKDNYKDPEMIRLFEKCTINIT